MIRTLTICSATALATALACASPASALTMKECGAKYQSAKQANTLNGQKWADFRKAQCGDDDASTAEAAAAVPDEVPGKTSDPAKSATKTSTEKGAPAVKATAPSGKVAFPSEISAKYASESPGRARLHTCVDQYRANKDSGGNGDLKWIQKGGGYYSQCNAKLKS
ncbi:hypothetical protein [Hansschlegelia plantiphila]|uniref:Uncharacterized protein n=1 Tax=Hansschlegelia plantiphila TaxID=374655 RepID=A0A9W6MU62_9HYPH|nr:hypothetical protein [Hansschlegelia plantiphila]GLK66627.1 hypothetical protein GCM10008179_02650 [Hansschlegelia plantiphila]